MENQARLIESSMRILKKSQDLEQILSFLREGGSSKTQSMLILKEIQNITLYEAKVQVHFSQTWEDTREYDEMLEELFFDVIEL